MHLKLAHNGCWYWTLTSIYRKKNIHCKMDLRVFIIETFKWRYRYRIVKSVRYPRSWWHAIKLPVRLKLKMLPLQSQQLRSRGHQDAPVGCKRLMSFQSVTLLTLLLDRIWPHTIENTPGKSVKTCVCVFPCVQLQLQHPVSSSSQRVKDGRNRKRKNLIFLLQWVNDLLQPH